MKGHGKLLRGMTPQQLVEQVLDTDGRFERQVLDERLFGPSTEEEQRKTRLTVQVGLVVIGALIASGIALAIAHGLGL